MRVPGCPNDSEAEQWQNTETQMKKQEQTWQLISVSAS
jgi:hypothetical protein